MSPITPRWEWRAFAAQFRELEIPFRSGAGEPPRRHETYLVSSQSGVNTKIRDDLADVKVLLQVDRRGIEQWMPVLKAPFPIDAAALRTLFIAWGLPDAPYGDRRWTRAELVALVASNPALAIVEVEKVRYGSTLDGCMAELADLTFDGEPVRTLAVEATDADRVWDAVLRLGLSTSENVSYVKALRRFVARRQPHGPFGPPGRAPSGRRPPAAGDAGRPC
jgi:exopolyphosphatase/guanosine-5'-triphosphate,3'-diphosphate pyrophosphatase